MFTSPTKYIPYNMGGMFPSQYNTLEPHRVRFTSSSPQLPVHPHRVRFTSSSPNYPYILIGCASPSPQVPSSTQRTVHIANQVHPLQHEWNVSFPVQLVSCPVPVQHPSLGGCFLLPSTTGTLPCSHHPGPSSFPVQPDAW
jgi:hypothetical protein